MASPAAQGHRRFEEPKAAGSLHVTEEGSSPSKFLDALYQLHARLSLTCLTGCFLTIFVQAIQEVFTAKKWVKDTRNEARAMDNLHAEVSKSLVATKSKKKELALKLSTADRDRRSTEANLKTVEVQAKEQR